MSRERYAMWKVNKEIVRWHINIKLAAQEVTNMLHSSGNQAIV